MSNLNDLFNGSSGPITGHTSDSGHTWGPSGTGVSLDGSGSITYAGAAAYDTFAAVSSWVPASADYEVSWTFGAGVPASPGARVGVLIRAAATTGSFKAYLVCVVAGSPDVLNIIGTNEDAGTLHEAVLADVNLGSHVAAGDTFKAVVAGSNPTYINIYRGSTPVLQYADSSGWQSTGGNSVGVFVGTGAADAIRDVAAGPIADFSGVYTLNHSEAHPGFTAILTIAWLGGHAPASPVTFTPSTSVGPFSPASITLPAVDGSSATTTLSVPGGATAGSYTIAVVNTGGLPSGSVPYTVRPVNAQIRTVARGAFPADITAIRSGIWPAGNVACLFFEDMTAGNNPSNVVGVDLTGVTVSVNGGTPIPAANPVWNAQNNFVHWPLNSVPLTGSTPTIVIVDELDAACTLGGAGAAWSQEGFDSQGSLLYATGVPAETGSFTRQQGYSGSATATATYTLNGVTPGVPWVVRRNLPDIYNGSGLRSRNQTPTTDARYVITGGAAPVTVDLDQTNVNPTFDRTWLKYRWQPIATVIPTGTSLTVTVTNHAGSGYLVTDAIMAEQPIANIVNPGDTVLLNAPDSWAQTAAGLVAPSINLLLPLLSIAELYPFNEMIPASMGVSYNVSRLAKDDGSSLLANFADSMDLFGASTDPSTNVMTAISTSSGSPTTSNVRFDPRNAAVDGFGVKTIPSNLTWHAIFNSPGGAAGAVNVAFQTAGDITGWSAAALAVTPATPTTDIVLTATATRDPGPYNSPRISITAWGATAGAVVNNLRIFDANTPIDWPYTAHKSLVDRLKGNFPGGRLRFMIATTTAGVYWPQDFSKAAGVSHEWSVLSRGCAAGQVTYIGPYTGTAATNAATSTDRLPTQANVSQVQVTISVPHLLKTADNVQLLGQTTGNFQDTGTGSSPGVGTTVDNFGHYITVVDDHNFIIQLQSSSGTVDGTTSSVPTTLLHPLTLNGTERFLLPLFAGLPYEKAVAICNDTGKDYWLNIPDQMDDPSINALGLMIATNLTPGLKCPVEFSNEVWNTPGAQQIRVAFKRSVAEYLYVTTGGAQGGNFFGTDGIWYAWKSGRVHQIVRAGGTGVPAVFIDGYGAGATGHVTVAGGVVSGIFLDKPGSGYTSAPTVTIFGGAGSGATATATVAGGVVTGLAMTAAGSGYTLTGRPATDFVRVMGTHPGNLSVTGHIADGCSNFGITFDEIAPNSYEDNLAPGADASNPTSHDTAANFLRPVDLVQMYAVNTLWADRSAFYNAHLALLADPKYGGAFANVDLVTYEGNLQQFDELDVADPYGPPFTGGGSRFTQIYSRRFAAWAHPEAFFLRRSWLQQRAERYELSNMCLYTLDQYDGLDGGTMWFSLKTSEQQPGTGNPLENANPWDQDTTLSQVFGGELYYAASATRPPGGTADALFVVHAACSSTKVVGSTASSSLVLHAAATGRRGASTLFAASASDAVVFHASASSVLRTATATASAAVLLHPASTGRPAAVTTFSTSATATAIFTATASTVFRPSVATASAMVLLHPSSTGRRNVGATFTAVASPLVVVHAAAAGHKPASTPGFATATVKLAVLGQVRRVRPVLKPAVRVAVPQGPRLRTLIDLKL